MNGKIQQMSRFLVSFMLLVIVVSVIEYFIRNEVNASAYYSYDINGINESQYPGYKSALLKLKEEHPNWTFKLCYTGLDWQTVINNEWTGHGGSPKSLIYDTYSDEWLCPECGTRKYDLSGRWYCASQEAIKYMMDPRNALTEQYIFQFQDLSSSVGDRDAVKKMTENTFLYNDSYIDTIMNAAKQNNVSPFHIVSRIIQEQGNDGSGPYVTGYVYNGRTVYNLFNIGASGGVGEYESGAKRAYEEGWFSLESSIMGGAKFIKENYINRGQTSLYFQKYNVVESGNLYNHQYMQNIEAARSEGLMTYNGYKASGIENSSFEFVIPLYKNMPQYASYRPNESYMGEINTNLTTMNLIESNGHKYISGDIEIAEWINDTCYTPKSLPELYLKSEDGTFSKKLYSYYKQGLTYYYDTIVDTLDVTKNYYIEAKLTSPRNAGTTEMKTQRVSFANKTLGTCANGELKAKDNLLKFTYVGTISTKVNGIELIESNGNTYIRGTVDIKELVNGVSYVPNGLPELYLKSTDGTFSKKMYRYQQNGNTYYYDTTIDKLDITKEYYIEATLVNQDNIGTAAQKTQVFTLEDKTLGLCNNNYVRIEDSKIKFTYQGIIETELQSINMQDNGEGRHYISGNIKISEIIDGKYTIPNILPELTLKTEDGFAQKMYLYHSGNGMYYYDTYIEDLDTTKKYYIEARLTNPNNVASEEQKAKKVVLPEIQLGKIGENKVFIQYSLLQYIDANLYVGNIQTKQTNISMQDNGAGRHYISGNIEISEIVEGVAKVPTTLPELNLKTVDGFTQKMYIYHSGNGSYYFDTYIEDVDKEKEYYIEASLTNPKNLAEEGNKKQQISIVSKELGVIKDKKAIIENNNLKFIDKDKYSGTITTKLDGIYLNDNGAGRHYISGNIQIKEIINGQSTICTTLPELKLKTSDGFEQKMYVNHSGNGSYYFDTYIEDIDKTKQYYIEASLTNANNMAESNQKTQMVNITSRELGKMQNLKVTIQNNYLKFIEADKYEGNISTKLDGIYLNDNGAGRHYISGNIQIKEIVNGKETISETLPQLTLKTSDGFEQKMYIHDSGKGSYYFDTYIEDLDTTKQYYIEASLTNPNNVSSQKTEVLTIPARDLGNIKQDSILVTIENNRLVFKNL